MRKLKSKISLPIFRNFNNLALKGGKRSHLWFPNKPSKKTSKIGFIATKGSYYNKNKSKVCYSLKKSNFDNLKRSYNGIKKPSTVNINRITWSASSGPSGGSKSALPASSNMEMRKTRASLKSTNAFVYLITHFLYSKSRLWIVLIHIFSWEGDRDS